MLGQLLLRMILSFDLRIYGHFGSLDYRTLKGHFLFSVLSFAFIRAFSVHTIIVPTRPSTGHNDILPINTRASVTLPADANPKPRNPAESGTPEQLNTMADPIPLT